MFAVLKTILGSKGVVESGMQLIDKMHVSKEEEIAIKSQSRVQLLQAYQPFKLCQRYLALMFSFTFLSSYVLVLGMTISGYGDAQAVTSVMDQFSINYAMLIILSFYFAGGAVEGFLNNKKGKKE
tara:strand:+ start:927 stop:1301 length:375 start_codon:yes stop_codon:yes gene_type:complete